MTKNKHACERKTLLNLKITLKLLAYVIKTINLATISLTTFECKGNITIIY